MLLIVPVVTHCQSFILRTDILDSLIFETRKGRSCDTLVQKQEIEIQKLGAELIANGQVIVLLQKESSTLDALVKNCENISNLAKQEYGIQKERFLVKIRKLWRVVVIEGGVIIVLIILLV